MKKIISLTILLTIAAAGANSQTQPAAPAAPAGRAVASPNPAQPRQQRPTPRPPEVSGFDLSEFGVSFQTEPRLIIRWRVGSGRLRSDAQTAEPPPLLAQVRRDLAGLIPTCVIACIPLRTKQTPLPRPLPIAKRYVSLAFAGPPPLLKHPNDQKNFPPVCLKCSTSLRW